MSTLLQNTNFLIRFIIIGFHRLYIGFTYPILVIGNLLTVWLGGKLLSIVAVYLEKYAKIFKELSQRNVSKFLRCDSTKMKEFRFSLKKLTTCTSLLQLELLK